MTRTKNPTATNVTTFNRVHKQLVALEFGHGDCKVGDAMSLAAGDPYVVVYTAPKGYQRSDVDKLVRPLKVRGFRWEFYPKANTLVVTHPGLDMERSQQMAGRHEGMMFDLLVFWLHPARMRVSGQFHAMLAVLLGEENAGWTTPALAGLTITSDDFILGMRQGDFGYNDFLGAADDLRSNIRGLCEAANCTEREVNFLLAQVEARKS